MKRGHRNQRSKAKVTADKPLTEREQRFVDAYLQEPDACKAAKAAGYDCKMDRAYAALGCRIKNKPNVAAAIARRMAIASAKADVKVVDVLRELGLLAFANMADFLELDEATGLPRFKPFDKLTRDQLAAVSEMTIDTETEFDAVKGAIDESSGATRVTRIRFKLHSKRDALVDLGRYLKMFIDNRDREMDNDPAAFVFKRTLSAVDAVIAAAIAAAANRHHAGALPNGSLLPVEVLPPQA